MSADEKILPRPDVLNEMECGKFVLANLAAKRAKQIKDGAPPLVRIDSNHPLSIALAEIAAGKIKPIMGGDASAVDLDEDFSILDNMEIAEVGLLLPAFEDEDLSLGSFDGEDEVEEDVEEVDALSISALVEDEDEAEVVEAGDDISLDDLAQQEEGEESEQEDDSI